MFESNKSKRFGFRELDEEFFGLQVSLIMELIGFMVSAFNQSTTPLSQLEKANEPKINL